jgi:hypothetical protein
MTRRKSEKEQKKLADDARLARDWRAWHREQRDVVLTGPHGAVLAELFRMLDHLDCVAPAQLVGFARSINWAEIDYPTKLTVLHEINNSITALRVKRDLEPINDPLPGEPEGPFRLIKIILFPPPQEGANRGAARPE